MRVHYLQHVPFEGIGAIDDWIRARGHTLSGTRLFETPAGSVAGPAAEPGLAAGSAAEPAPTFPDPVDVDLLVVMGGPMNIYEHQAYPWLAPEKAFIAEVVRAGRAVLGICLGAQLLADVLGGAVTRGPQREIGWWPVTITPAGRAVSVFAGFPDDLTVLHWHGDTFAIPPGAVHAATSEACPNQAFALEDGRLVGLQFHLEETRESLAALVENAGNELESAAGAPWVATADALLRTDAAYEACRAWLFTLLDRMVLTVAQ
ncbi:MAG: type 1 glutamine amidotransferase [Thermoleophilia bacterium]|nr:type 1 glutamine amidotransferase [Thermoleophilia bacterium]